MQLNGLLCAYPTNWLQRQQSLAWSWPDLSAHIQPTGCTGSIHSPAIDRTSLCFSGQLAAQAAFTRLQLTGPLCASLANQLHRQHLPVCSWPDLSAFLWPTGCTGSIHPLAVDWTSLHFSGRLAAQAVFTCLWLTRPLCASLANQLHRQHSPACSWPDHFVHLRQLGTRAFNCLRLTRPRRWSETSSWQLNHSFLPQHLTLLYD
jgi:hypothetical protein